MVELRPATPADRELLTAVYASTRTDELAAVAWSPAEREAFVLMQFDAQDRHYRSHFPHADYDVVVVDGRPAGRFYVDRGPGELRVLDVALLPMARGRGIGTRLLRDLLAEADAAGVPVRLHVETFNPARRLYERLGFTAAGQSGVHVLMERPCATSPP